jgi:hypothetical protein
VAAGVDLDQATREIAWYLEHGRFAGWQDGQCFEDKEWELMHAVIKLALVGMATFAVALAARRVFFWDVMPVSWNDEPSTTGAVIAAYLLLSLENLGFGVATIAAAIGLVALARPLATKAVASFRAQSFFAALIFGRAQRPGRADQ